MSNVTMKEREVTITLVDMFYKGELADELIVLPSEHSDKIRGIFCADILGDAEYAIFKERGWDGVKATRLMAIRSNA